MITGRAVVSMQPVPVLQAELVVSYWIVLLGCIQSLLLVSADDDEARPVDSCLL